MDDIYKGLRCSKCWKLIRDGKSTDYKRTCDECKKKKGI